MRRPPIAVPALLLAAGLLASCSGTDAAPEAADVQTVRCDYPDDPQGPAKEVEKPSADAPVAGQVDLTMRTSAGDIALALDAGSAPCAVNSFRSLAEQGYFDDTQCHRLVPGFVLQCGDPSATGSGGPGYSFADELSGDETYSRGTLAMANAGANTNGSQFFIVIADAALPPSYTVLGSVDAAGMTVVDEIAAQGNGPDGVAPKRPVTIESLA